MRSSFGLVFAATLAVSLAMPRAASAQARELTFRVASGGYDYGLPTAKLQRETRKLFKSAADFQRYFGATPPSVDWSREWAVFYTPGSAALVRGSMATIRAVRLSQTGATLTITTRHLRPGNCAPDRTRPFVIAAFPKPAHSPRVHFSVDDYTRTCGSAPPASRSYGGVPFTPAQAVGALAAANRARPAELVAADMAQTASGIIVAGRPWASLDALAARPGIGMRTLRALRALSARYIQ